jgi:hypothetical protein
VVDGGLVHVISLIGSSGGTPGFLQLMLQLQQLFPQAAVCQRSGILPDLANTDCDRWGPGRSGIWGASMRAEILSIGSEPTSGQNPDTNRVSRLGGTLPLRPGRDGAGACFQLWLRT